MTMGKNCVFTAWNANLVNSIMSFVVLCISRLKAFRELDIGFGLLFQYVKVEYLFYVFVK